MALTGYGGSSGSSTGVSNTEKILDAIRLATGEIHASPTGTTMLGRLKQIEENDPFYIAREKFTYTFSNLVTVSGANQKLLATGVPTGCNLKVPTATTFFLMGLLAGGSVANRIALKSRIEDAVAKAVDNTGLNNVFKEDFWRSASGKAKIYATAKADADSTLTLRFTFRRWDNNQIAVQVSQDWTETDWTEKALYEGDLGFGSGSVYIDAGIAEAGQGGDIQKMGVVIDRFIGSYGAGGQIAQTFPLPVMFESKQEIEFWSEVAESGDHFANLLIGWLS